MTPPKFSTARSMSRPIRLTSVFAAFALAGCANFSADGGLQPISDRLSKDLSADTIKLTSQGDAELVANRVSQLLAQPVTAEAAIQIALINNRGLQARYNSLGISEAEFVETGLPPNPSFSFQRMAGDGSIEFERRIAGNLLGLFTLPARQSIAGSQFKAAQYRVLDATLRLASETRGSYYHAVAAEMKLAYLEQAKTAAEAVVDLALRLGETGAKSKLQQARAAGYNAQIAAQFAAAKFNALREREALVRILGLWGNQAAFKLASVLPPLPKDIDEMKEIESQAVAYRADLLAARHDLDATERALGLTQATRFVSVLELAGIDKTDRNGSGEAHGTRGFEVSIQIPIFDLGEISQRRARETYMRAFNELAEKAINVRSETRAAYYGYRAAFEIARAYEEQILPAQKVINDETLLHYNGMLIDVFELLRSANEGIATAIAAIDARRDFFIAQSQFKSVLTGGASMESGPTSLSLTSVTPGQE